MHKLLKISDSSRYILSHFSLRFLYSPKTSSPNKWECAKAQCRASFRASCDRDECLLFTKIMVVILITTVDGVGGKESEEMDNAKKSRKIGRSSAPWSKESLKRAEEGAGGAAGLLFFATLSSPAGRKYTRRRTVPERMPLKIRRGKIPEKKKQSVKETEGMSPKWEPH